ncbi:MAG TPA: transposase, partial [Ilumatobacter sp.]|nr:transposase [Ilumatobacter sp.]
MNRGAARRDVFFGARDGLQFVHLLAEGSAASDIEVHAYCLMPNHFHLILHCPNRGLSDFMRGVGSMYTRYLNHRRGADGPIFRGRFHSLSVDTPEYLDRAARYVHRNPIELNRPEPIDRYRWSSYGAYVGTRRPPSWLHVQRLSGYHGGPSGYRTFVEGDVAGDTCAGFDWAIDTAIAECDDETISRMPHVRRALTVAMFDRADDRSRPVLEQMLGFASV